MHNARYEGAQDDACEAVTIKGTRMADASKARALATTSTHYREDDNKRTQARLQALL